MKIEGYDFEITEFPDRAEADAALVTAKLEDPEIKWGVIVPLPIGDTYIVRLRKGEHGGEVYYL